MFFVRMDEPETNSMTFPPPFRVFAPWRRTHRQPPFQWDAALLGEYSLLKQQKSTGFSILSRKTRHFWHP